MTVRLLRFANLIFKSCCVTLDLQITSCYSLLRLIWDLQISVTTDLQINLHM